MPLMDSALSRDAEAAQRDAEDGPLQGDGKGDLGGRPSTGPCSQLKRVYHWLSHTDQELGEKAYHCKVDPVATTKEERTSVPSGTCALEELRAGSGVRPGRDFPGPARSPKSRPGPA